MDVGEPLVERLFGSDHVASGPTTESSQEHFALTLGGVPLLAPLRPTVVRSVVVASGADDRWRERFGKRIIAAGLNTPRGDPLLRRRMWIETGSGSLHAHLSDVLDTPVAITATFGPDRPNRKPVMRIFNATGRLLAYAKVGWNQLTRELVTREAENLEWLSARNSDRIETPRVISSSRWRDLEVLVSEPISVTPAARERDRVSMPIALESVVRLTPQRSTALIGSPFWSAVAPEIDLRLRTAIEGQWGDSHILWGFGHGDWTPWNMSRGVDCVAVWDWERAGDDVPLGLDAIHYHFQRRLRRSRDTVQALELAVSEVVAGRYDRAIDDTEAMTALYTASIAQRFADSDPVPRWVSQIVDRAVGPGPS